MKKNIFIALTFLSMFFALPVQADVKDDTTTVVLRKTITVNGSFNGNTGNHAPVFVPSINVSIVTDDISCFICIDTGNFQEDYVSLKISGNDNEIIYIDEMIPNINTIYQVDISSLPIGIYTISIKDGDEEYIGEFEVLYN